MATRKSSKNSKKKNNNMFTFACFVLALLVILLVFMVKRDQILSNFKETNFFDRVFGTTPEFVQNHEGTASDKQVIPLNDEITINIETESKPQVTIPEESPVVVPVQAQPQNSAPKSDKESEKPLENKPANTDNSTKPAQNQPVQNTQQNTAQTKPAVPAKTELSLCFIVIDGDGSVSRKIIKRSVNKNDSPLSTAINLLLQGPNTTLSTEKNCDTLIPRGTKLLSAKVQNGVAYLNFNEALEYNQMGFEGQIHSLEQIVFTATSFSTVNSVQFLIDGQKKEYLGSEGIRIGAPLSKGSF